MAIFLIVLSKVVCADLAETLLQVCPEQGHILSVLLTNCVTLGQQVNLSQDQFPYL